MNYETYEVRVCDNGDKYWYQNGKRHRIDGPAAEFADGIKFWFQNGKLHRIDGPAIECSNGDKYWLNDKLYSYEEWKTEVARLTHCDGKVVEIDGKQYQLKEVK